jgi:hypothetical protein
MEALRQLKAEIQQLEARTLRRSVGLRRTFNAERAVLVGGARAKPSRKKKAKKKAKKKPPQKKPPQKKPPQVMPGQPPRLKTQPTAEQAKKGKRVSGPDTNEFGGNKYYRLTWEGHDLEFIVHNGSTVLGYGLYRYATLKALKAAGAVQVPGPAAAELAGKTYWVKDAVQYTVYNGDLIESGPVSK